MNRVDCLKDPHLGVYQEVTQTDLLRKIVIFKDLSQKSLSIIEKRIQTLELKKGEQIISEAEVAKGVYFVRFVHCCTGNINIEKALRYEGLSFTYQICTSRIVRC
ncbi:hypothetical protein ACSU6B_11095 [Neobacillus sp. C211]|uniref:hypothetical protein n=1 Tax=unclassified Neobacillus TaxID=2675272 RepID=UPI00397DD5FF